MNDDQYEYSCSECSKSVGADDEFCPSCGADLREVIYLDKTPNPSGSENQLSGPGGWLSLFIFTLVVLTPLSFLVNLFALFPHFSLLSETGYFNLIIADTIVSSVLMIYGIYAGIRLWSIKPDAVASAKRFLIINLAGEFSVFLFFAAVYMDDFGYDISDDYLIGLLRTILFVALWYAYLLKSERVKNTYFPRPPVTKTDIPALNKQTIPEPKD